MTGTIMTFPGQHASTEETQLLNRLRAIEIDRTGYFAVHLHLSKLRPSNRKPHFINIAARAIEPLLNNFEATLYKLGNSDFVIICREVPVEEVDPVIFKVRQLFGEDPLAAGEDGAIDDRFSTWYDFAQQGDFASFVENANALTVEAAERQQKQSETRAPNSLPGTRLDPSSVGEIQIKLQGVKIDDLIEEQTCIVVHSGAKGDVMFREQFVSMRALQQRIAPDVNLFGSPWLFLYLTETVDRRLLAEVCKRDFAEMKEPISLNLNISTVLGREFQLLHQKVEGNVSKVVIELQLIDVFSDITSFAAARDLLQDFGYRVLIDGINPLALQFFDPAMLEADLVKISWGQEFESEGAEDRIEEMRQVVRNMGCENVILARADSEDAVMWALNLGISRFQGHYIDTVVTAMLAKGII